jgi:3-oxoadipate enol-lactonase
MGALFDQLGPKMFGPAATDEQREKLRAVFDGIAPEVAAADALAMRDRPDSTGDLAGIDVPVLWLHGEDDALMPIDGARATAEKIPGAHFVAIPKAGHAAAFENAEAVNAAIAEFLKSQS